MQPRLRLRAAFVPVLAGVLAALAAGGARAEAGDAPGWTYDVENAREILETCAGCHGRTGRGGKGGAYPRIAGLDERYIVRQIEAFKSRERMNIPMAQYTTERELPDRDVRDIARLYAQIVLPTKMPELPPDASALARLEAAVSVFNIPPVPGDVARGADLYEENCSDCHGEEGWGEDDTPQLAGQYTEYLRRQLAKFRSGERRNEDMDGVLDDLTDADLEDVFAYLASRDD